VIYIFFIFSADSSDFLNLLLVILLHEWQICRQEYSQTINVVLGLQAGLSLIIGELTMVCLHTLDKFIFCPRFVMECPYVHVMD
jgi:ABC-type uncharacterized transport system YnjBCD permease subunit